MDPRFIHLRTRSAYSLLEGAIHVKKLPGLAAGLEMPAIGLADSGNLFGALEFSEAAAKAGVQPLLGLTLMAGDPPARPGEKADPPAPLVLYAQNEAGWLNLMALTSAGFLEGDGTGEPWVALSRLEGRSDGLICLTGGADGQLGRLIRAGKTAAAGAFADRLAALFPDRLYVELQRHGTGASGTAEALTEAERAAEP
ncbi:MAG: PHP domain-containing protein, partial [Pseudomonadota bacterium]